MKGVLKVGPFMSMKKLIFPWMYRLSYWENHPILREIGYLEASSGALAPLLRSLWDFFAFRVLFLACFVSVIIRRAFRVIVSRFLKSADAHTRRSLIVLQTRITASVGQRGGLFLFVCACWLLARVFDENFMLTPISVNQIQRKLYSTTRVHKHTLRFSS